MDPITHALIGAAVSTFSGTPAGLDNPVTLGAMLGAMAPDLDFVIRFVKDDAQYLTHHRGASHSIPFLIGFSVVITALLTLAPFREFSFFQTLIWTFLGALSHTGMDILNSYGAKLFRKKLKANLLTLYDPVFTLIGGYLILTRQHTAWGYSLSLLIIGSYLSLRYMVKRVSEAHLIRYFTKYDSKASVYVMPALKAFYKWDYVVHTEKYDYVGQLNPFCFILRKCSIESSLQVLKKENEVYNNIVKTSVLGRKFAEFSPNLHVSVLKEGEFIVLRIMDLRYFFKNDFLHQATLTLDKDMNVLSSIMHPYSLKKSIAVNP